MEEDGPYEVLIKARELAGVDGWEHKHFWTTCFLCTSFWMAVVLFFMPDFVRKILAANAIAILIEAVNEWQQQK